MQHRKFAATCEPFCSNYYNFASNNVMNQHSDPTMNDPFDPIALLNWYVEMGVDECIGSESIDRYAHSADMLERKKALMAQKVSSSPQGMVDTTRSRQAPPKPQQEVRATDEMVHSAVELARKATNVDELKSAVMSFEGCPLKTTAMNTVFSDGNPKADIMFIGDAPGADEDRKGIPFSGAQGQLFDKMLASCGLEKKVGERTRVYISNIVFWRPPGNRPLTPSEIAVCLPFVERHIELVDPKIVVILGGVAAKAILGKHESVAKLRGRWFEHATPGLSRPVQAMVLYHPESLIRSPAQKRRAWSDLLSIVKKLETL
jgi:uracil-DNA glycosylase